MERGDHSPGDLANVLGSPVGLVAYHVRMLREYGLVEEAHTEPRRGALAHFYRRTELAEEILRKLNGMLELPNAGRSGQERRREQLAEWASAAA